VLSLMLFGGETLRDFAFALLVGIASGTYSSVFIATPVLAHWKEREPVYRARDRRIRKELGYVPAYATAAQGGPVDVAPKESRRATSLTAPADPTQVSRSEFDEMVANLGIEEASRRQPAAAGPARPRGGRRARAQGNGPAPAPPTAPPAAPPGGDAGSTGEQPEGGDSQQRKPRNRKHGRPR
jgi:SecD/SecF fusion protein